MSEDPVRREGKWEVVRYLTVCGVTKVHSDKRLDLIRFVNHEDEPVMNLDLRKSSKFYRDRQIYTEKSTLLKLFISLIKM